MFDQKDLLEYLIQCKIDRLSIEALYADETELKVIEAVQEALEKVITGITEPVHELYMELVDDPSYDEFGNYVVRGIPAPSTELGRDIANYCKKESIKYIAERW